MACCFVQALKVVLTLVVFFKHLRLLCGPLVCCFVQALKVVLTLVFLFKQLRLLCGPLACCFVQALKAVSEPLACCYVQALKVVSEPLTCCYVQALKVVCKLWRVENGGGDARWALLFISSFKKKNTKEISNQISQETHIDAVLLIVLF